MCYRASPLTRLKIFSTPTNWKVSSAKLAFYSRISNVVILLPSAQQARASQSVEYPALVPTSRYCPGGAAAASRAMNRPDSGGICLSLRRLGIPSDRSLIFIPSRYRIRFTIRTGISWSIFHLSSSPMIWYMSSKTSLLHKARS